MNKIILKIELGNWDGGNNGIYPKLLEWNLDNTERPIDQSDGWGHGLGGHSLSLAEFVQTKGFKELENSPSQWVYEILLGAVNSGLNTRKIERLLLEASKEHMVDIPNHLLEILNRFVRYANA